MYKKMVNPLAHGVSKHHLLKEAPESKESTEESRLWEKQPKRRCATKWVTEKIISFESS